MNNELQKNEIITIAISTFSLVISIVTLILSFLIPYLRKYKINKAFQYMIEFYDSYALLNPWLLKDPINKDKYITQELIKQKILFYSFPRFKYSFFNNLNNFNPLSFYGTNWQDNLKWNEILKFKNTWKLINNKINNIKSIINKYTYIISNEFNIIDYSNNFDNIIERTSISICLSFDEIKMNYAITESKGYFENKIDLLETNTYNNKEYNKFKKELEEMNFSINIRFKNKFSTSSFGNPLSIYSYSIYFKNEIIKKIESNFKNKQNMMKIDEEENRKHLNWISKIFRKSNN